MHTPFDEKTLHQQGSLIAKPDGTAPSLFPREVTKRVSRKWDWVFPVGLCRFLIRQRDVLSGLFF
jgi:hypothetical protein